MSFIKLCKSIILFLIKNNKLKLTNEYIDISFKIFLSYFKKLVKKCIYIKNTVSFSIAVIKDEKYPKYDSNLYNHKCLLCNTLNECKNIKSLFDIILENVLQDKNLINIFDNSIVSNESVLDKNIKFSLDVIDLFNNVFKKNEMINFYKSFFTGDNVSDIGKNFLEYLLNCKKINKIKKLTTTSLVISSSNNIKIKINQVQNCNCKVCYYLNELSINNFRKLITIFDDNLNDKMYDYYLDDINLTKRKFTLFRKNNYLNNDCQWYELFKNETIFLNLKTNNVFIKIIGIVRYFMLPIIYYKNCPHNYSITNFEKYCNYSVKEWKKYTKKHIDKFYNKDTIHKKCVDIKEHHCFYLDQVHSFQEEIIKYDLKEKYEYLFDIDESNVYDCFCSSYRKILDECKYILTIFYTIQNFKDYNKLKKYITKKVIGKINSIIGNIVREWLTIYFKRDIYFQRLDSKYLIKNDEYELDIFIKLDNVINIIINEQNIDFNEDINDEIYSPESVQDMINEFKIH